MQSASARRPASTSSKPPTRVPSKSRAVWPSPAASASTTSTFVPPSARARATLATTVLFPPLSRGETKTTDNCGPRSARTRSMNTAANRNASAAAECGSVRTESRPPAKPGFGAAPDGHPLAPDGDLASAFGPKPTPISPHRTTPLSNSRSDVRNCHHHNSAAMIVDRAVPRIAPSVPWVRAPPRPQMRYAPDDRTWARRLRRASLRARSPAEAPIEKHPAMTVTVAGSISG